MSPITIKEVEYASRILFNGDSTKFYDDIDARTGERVTAIQCLENKPIVACPGSGKTTVLLAKLIILSNRMPFDDGRGICVLTHTNVAIDLIKDKLGVDAFKLFAYPNFFGTLQSFVDRFLAIPSFVNSMGFRPIIDSNLYDNKVQSEYEKAKYLPKRWIDPRGGYEYIRQLCFNMNNPKIISNGLFGHPFAPEEKDYYQKIKAFKETICRYGYLKFDEAYTLASSYVQKHESIIYAFQERFKFVFIDEMQDTAIHQSKIINTLFQGSEKTIIQEFGDPNQAIYDYDGQKGEWKYDENDCLHLTKSKRFGEQIANAINPLRIKTNEPPLEGENQDSILPPHLIIFDKADKTVLDEFGQLIVKYELHKIKDSTFVAIGRVGKEKDEGKITLKTYWDGFEKASAKNKEHFPTLIEYLAKDLPDKKNYSERIINGILQLLELHEFKKEIQIGDRVIQRRYTKTTLFDYLKKDHEELYFEFRTFISDCGLKIKKEKENFNIGVYKLILEFVSDKILSLKNIQFDKNISFLQISEAITNQNQQEKQTNVYHYNDESGVIVPIKINTIHGEKGETHTATLYLETYKNGSYDSSLIKKQLEGKSFKPSYNETASKIAYVAMSRPEMLLCFAVSSERISEEYAKTKLKPVGWTI